MKAADMTDAIELTSAAADPHQRALAALDDPEHGSHAAVAWCSAHLCAADSVLYTAAQRRLPDGRKRVAALRVLDHRLQQALCLLDRRVTGDVHLAGVAIEAYAEAVRSRLQAHAEAEAQLIEELTVDLSVQDEQELCVRLTKAMLHAPTRPHPYTRHSPLSRLIARLDATVDRVRDVLDNRVVPTPQRPRTPCVPGRWGSYLMAQPYPSAQQQQPGQAGATGIDQPPSARAGSPPARQS